MCGIVGILSTRKGGFFKAEVDIFSQMLYVDALRGPDSTGAFCVHNNGQVSGFKHAAPPQVSQSTRGYQEFVDAAARDGRILIGHNRKATHGTISNDNSHPFYEEHIILVHNGMLQSTGRYKQRDVDSHAFAATLAHTVPADVPQLIADVDGAYAFVWYDMNQKKLFFVRNEQRPLFVAEYDGKFVFSSEYWVSQGICHRVEHNIKHGDEEKAWELWSTKAGLLYSLDVNGTLESKDLPAKKATVIYPGPRTTMTGTYSGASSNVTTSAVVSCSPHTGPQQQAASQTHAGPSQQQTTSTGTRTVLPFNRQLSGPATSFKMGEHVVIKLTKARFSQGGTAFVEGKVEQLGKPAWDVSGELPRDTDIADLQTWLDNPLIGTICGIYTGLACGPSLKVKDLFLSPSYLATKSWNKVALQGPEWKHIGETCKCKHCEQKLQDYDRPFTNVKVDTMGNIEMVCADCIEKRIDNAEIKKQFESDRFAAMENWQPLSHESGTGTVKPTQVEGPATLQ